MTDTAARDLTPATQALALVLAGVRDDQLALPTPCSRSTVADLIDHVDGFCQGFIAAAAKTVPQGSSQPSADGSRLGRDWRERIPRRLDDLAAAWTDPSAWDGMTQAGGVELPGAVAGLVALDEVLVHGWDIAAATGQDYDCGPELAEGALGFVRGAVAQNPEGSPGLFGPPVPVPESAPAFDQLLGLTGRDPSWRAA
jgi:uncharacterized protein (TIGR03086 family)